MMRNTILITICLLFSLSFLANAQKAKFEFYTTDDGLAGNHTNTVTQDDQGFIWFINDYKIHRFDGRNFVVYPSPPPEIPGSGERINLMASYQDSLLFFVSLHYAFLLNPKTGHWQSFQPGAESGETYSSLYSFQIGPADILLYCQDLDEVWSIWRFRNQKLERVKISPSIHINSEETIGCFFDAKGNTNVYSAQTLYQLDASGEPIAEVSLKEISNGLVLFGRGYYDPNNALVVLTDQNFFTLDEGKKKFSPHPLNRFLPDKPMNFYRFIMEDDGSIWASGLDKTLVYYDAIEDTLYNFRKEMDQLIPYRNDFHLLFKDKTGTIWVPSRMGLLKVTLQSSLFDTYFNRARSECNGYCSFRGMAEDAQGMIYGAFYNGITKFDPYKKQEYPPYSFYRQPFGILGDGERIWLNDGMYLDTGLEKIIELSDSRAIPFFGAEDEGVLTRDKAGGIWRGYQSYLLSLDQSQEGMYWREEIQLPVKGVLKADAFRLGQKSGKLWISYGSQVFAYAPESRELSEYNLKDFSPSVSRVMGIEEDGKGDLWLATDAGLVHFSPTTKAITAYTEQDGLSNNFVCGLLTEGDSCLWLSTNKGLCRFQIEQKTFINFYEEDGLTHNEFNRMSYFKARDGRMFFGGLRGVNAFYPEELVEAYSNKNKEARMVLSAFEHVDERQDTIIREYQFSDQPEIQLYHWDRSFIFDYALTDYNNSQEIAYSYQMEGYENTWSTPSRFNFTRYSSLPAGHYTFRVRARDSRGLWHPSILSVSVIVHPPWWATWWAYLLYTLLILGIAYVIFRVLKRRLLLQNQLKREQEEATRLKELDHFKSRLYTNLTHEFRTPLTVILGMADQIESNPKNHLTEGIQLIRKNGQNLLRLINQLLDLSRLENKSFKLHVQQGDIIPYLRYMTESFQTYANGKNLSLRFFATLEALVMDYDPEQIKQVLTNLISNAVKFTPSGGMVKVRVTTEHQQLNLEVIDTGIGIAAADLPHIFDRFYQVDSSHTRQGEGTGIGLAHTLELLKIMGGRISVKSEPGKGTNFLVCLPIQTNANIAAVGPEKVEPLVLDQPTSSIQDSGIGKNGATRNNHLPQLLIIEDNTDVVIYLKSCLKGLYQMEVAYNGKIGIEKALEHIPDLIISDVMMPEKNGYEVCDTLKNDEKTSHIPIILLTAKADASSRLTGLKTGADAYLSKPFDREELLIRLENLLEVRRKLKARYKNLAHASPLDEKEGHLAEEAPLEDAFLLKARQIVEDNLGNNQFSIEQFCQKMAMSRMQLHRKLSALTDQSASHFIRGIRLQQSKVLLRQSLDVTISEVAYEVGFNDPKYFSRVFTEEFGVSPSAFREGSIT
ncbi:MAG: hybrid sensor histidine kinase/response regulator [Saprospiraceae bacterium]|nr:MAG: hybrid sensor histidine kinase/response regulator [Saprospiraceae bacterium]